MTKILFITCVLRSFLIKAHYNMASAIKLELVWKSFTLNPSDKSMLFMQHYSYVVKL